MSLQKILIPVQQEIGDLEGTMMSLLGSQVPFVQSVAEYILKIGGKRLRPILTVISSRLSGYNGADAYKMGACLEFIHTASLLHDDVIDNAQIRRGKPSANAKWGNHVSVLVGDFFYCRASQLLTEQADLRILKVVTDCITATTEGEVLEITKSSDLATTRDDYLAIVKNKTALLIAAACQVGGILGKVSEELESALKKYGYHLGMAFQLADDILDYTSSEDVFGKANGIDLQEGKLTLPLIITLGRATNDEAQIIRNALLSERLEKQTFLKVQDVIKKYGGFDETRVLAREFINTAKASLAPFRASIEKDVLLSIADYVIERDR
jgi:octaprenyl-diphosphate synthase